MPSRGRVDVKLLGTVLAACSMIALQGCSGSSKAMPSPSGSSARAVFDDQGGEPISCLKHQSQQPTSAYRAGASVVSELELPMLAYYTANGNKSYCDGKPAGAVDQAWLATYVQDGADPTHIRRNRP